MTADRLPEKRSGPDPRAVAAARDLRQRLDAECVILLGSRAWGDYREGSSDIDFITIINGPLDRDTEVRVRNAAGDAVRLQYGQHLAFDSIAMTPGQYELKSRHSINHPAASAAREGIFLPGTEGEYGRESGEEFETDYAEEAWETRDRIADANGWYGSMQALIDTNADDLTVLGSAQKALEHGLKAYISARTSSYAEIHDLEELADRTAELDRRDPGTQPLEFQSDIQRLSAFAGYQSYGPLTGGEDYRELSNSVTADLTRIYALIQELTQENPWDVPTRLRGLRVEPRQRRHKLRTFPTTPTATESRPLGPVPGASLRHTQLAHARSQQNIPEFPHALLQQLLHPDQGRG